ncbi:hypothetical protein V8E54_010739 [Elaphomyces granulatus]
MSFDGVPLQDLLPGCPLHEQIDLAAGTSSGGLIALGLFESLAVRCSGEQMFKRLGYTLVRPSDIDKEPLLWEVCLGFPNPTELALWESAHIWPDTAPDIVISLGTGIEPRKALANSGRSRYQDIENSNGLGKYARSSFFRFNTQLHSAIRDDIANLDQIRQGIHQCPRSWKGLVEVASALLISN